MKNFLDKYQRLGGIINHLIKFFLVISITPGNLTKKQVLKEDPEADYSLSIQSEK